MPDSPYPSWRLPTSTVMFTVTVGRDASGKSSTRAPLSSRYSVTPSIEATLTGGSASAVSPSQENPTEREQLTHDVSLRERM